jgi:hypothetical protein
MNTNGSCVRRILSMLWYNIPLVDICKIKDKSMSEEDFYLAYREAIVLFRMEQDEK